jgi:hypothetical protein
MIYNITTKAQWREFCESSPKRSSVMAIDPDQKEYGWAFQGHRFAPIVAGAEALSTRCDAPLKGALIVAESQRVFPGATQRTKSIVDLARTAGLIAGLYCGTDSDVLFLCPTVWKGQIQKPKKVGQRFEYVIHQRNMARLGPGDQKGYLENLAAAKSKGRDFQFEVMDAVGILLFVLEGLEGLGVEL